MYEPESLVKTRENDVEENAAEDVDDASAPQALNDLYTKSPWEQTLKRVICGLVSIRNIAVRSFDTEKQRTSQASGFIVDKTLGIVLTNRHVVQPGPTIAEGILGESKEEVRLIPIYRDPVHDFGFLKFDVKEIMYMSLHEIPLCPDKARVGIDIRVVGNNAGEKLSILSGILARLDRQAPQYGVGRYNDWNTFYYQAASMTSGGSSGSPVINIDGEAIAVNAGGHTSAASSFFLPLDRVVRALSLIKSNHLVPRGTIQTTFVFKTFDELKRLSLDTTVEEDIRKSFPQATGMLSIQRVVPKGTADGILASGDIIYKLNGMRVLAFIPIEEVLDDSVGRLVNFTIQRGTRLMDVNVFVQDLHSVTPDRFVEVSGGIVHNLSYQMARTFMVPVAGLYVASPGYMLFLAGVTRKCIVLSVANQPTPDLNTFIKVFRNLNDNERVPVRFYALSDINTTRVSLMQVDRRYHSFRLAIRNDESGLWNYTALPPCPGVALIKPHSANPLTLEETMGPARVVVPSLVQVVFHLPFHVDGVLGTVYTSVGVVIDAEVGLLVVDRYAIPTSLGDVLLTFANSIIIPGKILYLHQVHNFAVVSYNTKLLGETGVTSAPLSDKELKQGDVVWMVALTRQFTPVIRKTRVSNVHQFIVSQPPIPQYRAFNSECYELETPLNHAGVVTDEAGQIQALWSCFNKHSKSGAPALMGLSTDLVLDVVYRIRESIRVNVVDHDVVTKGLEIEMAYTQIAPARVLGLSDEWVKQIEGSHLSRRNVLLIRRLTSGTAAASLLKEGDLLLAIDGRVVTRFRDVEAATGPLGSQRDSMELTILRDGSEINVDLPLSTYTTRGTERIVSFCGAVFQMPHKQVYQQLKEVPKGVLCSIVQHGSPAHLYGLSPMTFIQEVESKKTENLDQFLDVIKKINPGTFARFQTISFTRYIKVVGVRVDAHYFGVSEVRRNPNPDPFEWQLVSHDTCPGAYFKAVS
ncbi:hypothetical protein SeMB42_g06188 [Synchytrium endobioticum]|uniref:PDZ domain-containing protein n=1 Tax=Synchytrium endobioticum TaxID=286115 RepID=A0A507CK51_9FUNG|nr:hypothetical protein SeMB42_g06188 [Synchytrium endobioticum]